MWQRRETKQKAHCSSVCRTAMSRTKRTMEDNPHLSFEELRIAALLRRRLSMGANGKGNKNFEVSLSIARKMSQSEKENLQKGSEIEKILNATTMREYVDRTFKNTTPEIREMLKELYKKRQREELKKRDKKIYEERLSQGSTFRELGIKYGLSGTRVSYICHKQHRLASGFYDVGRD